ncbi:hypothetical protein Dimus_015617 [Dionaea muscipula]
MASSQVEISSSSPFGCVLKDHNGKDQHRCRDQSANTRSQSNFQRNLKELVRDHLHSCISISPRSSDSACNENSHHHHQTNGFSCWGCSTNSRGNTNRGGGCNPHLSKARNRDHDDEDEEPMPPMSRRRSRVLDRWAAQQAREMMTTIERQTHDAERFAMSMPTSSTAASPSVSVRDHSPAPSDTSSADLSVSSLVQKWRGYENQTQNSNQMTYNGVVVGSRASSVSATSTENASSVEACETTTMTGDEKFGSISCSNNETESESVVDWESDRTTHNRCDQVSPSPCGGDGGQVDEKGERERMRVVDIIRKWTSTARQRSLMGRNENEHKPQPVVLPQSARLLVGVEQGGGDQRAVYPVLCSPRLRGRQAIADLFTRIQSERHKEIQGLAACQAVTKFPQRGRIQSMLRLRFLRHDTLVEDQRRHHSRPCGSNRSQHRSTITNLRERFNEASEPGNADMKSLPKVNSKGNLDMEKASTSSNQPTEEMNRREESSREEINEVKETNEVETNDQEQIHPEETEHEKKDEVVINHEEASDEENNHHEDVNCQELNLDGTSQVNALLHAAEVLQVENIPSSDTIWQDTCTESCNLECQESSAYIETSYNNLEEDLIINYEEQEASNQQFLEANLDWINDISRPRSYWEDRRQAWYKEIFDSTSTNEEIRHLIERRSVSAALASAFRQRMDQLMMSCMQRQMHALEDTEEEEDQSMGAFLHGHLQSLGIQEEQQYDEQEREDEGQEGGGELEHEEEGEEMNGNEQEEDDDDDDDDDEREGDEEQTAGPESYRDDIGSTPFQQSPAITSYDNDTQEGSSFKNVSSIEMELIYDLRAHMEQLYREMSELRKSLKSCMDMQVMMQNSIREEVSAALGHSAHSEEKKVGDKKARKKGNCCICYEKKVDSLLYSYIIVGIIRADVGICAPVLAVPMNYNGVAGNARFVELR